MEKVSCFRAASSEGFDFHIRRAGGGSPWKVVRPAAAALSWCPPASNVLSPNELRAGESLETFQESFLHLLLSLTHHHELAGENQRGGLDWNEGGEEYDAKLVTPLSALNWSHGWGWKWMDLSTFLDNKTFYFRAMSTTSLSQQT